MLEPTQRTGSLPLGPASVAGAGLPSAGPAATSDGLSGARFQALLEELDQRAKAVARSACEPLSAESLPAAVEQARTSLEGAMQLGNSLLEACRQLAAQNGGPRP